MKTFLYILFLVVGVIVIGHLLAAAVGMIIYFAVAAVILGCIVSFVKYKLQQRQERKHPHRTHVRATKQADRTLKEIERTINKQ